MKRTIVLLSLFLIFGCSSIDTQKANNGFTQKCLGNTEIDSEFRDQFIEIEDNSLLNLALGSPNEGKLCWGKVYIAKQNSNILIYRAWNSTNPNSQMGQWWAFSKPTGLISTYRYNYEICYQWSPLDKLVYGRLKPGTKIVVGTGQSAKCSDYLTYPISDEKQIFIKDASKSIENPQVYDLIFKWQ